MTSILRIPRFRFRGFYLFAALLSILVFAICSFGQRTQEERREETLEKIRPTTVPPTLSAVQRSNQNRTRTIRGESLNPARSTHFSFAPTID